MDAQGVSFQDEARDFADGEVLAWGSCDAEDFVPDGGRYGFPGAQADDAWPGTQVGCAVGGGEDFAGVEELAAFGVEVVEVVFVAEEDGVDWGELVELEGWAAVVDEVRGGWDGVEAEGLQVDFAEEGRCVVFGAGDGSEEGVGEEGGAVYVEDGGGCCDVGDCEGWGWHFEREDIELLDWMCRMVAEDCSTME